AEIKFATRNFRYALRAEAKKQSARRERLRNFTTAGLKLRSYRYARYALSVEFYCDGSQTARGSLTALNFTTRNLVCRI
ncbi:hypothetical protein, partial [uncultured Campylobacter sp.]|uniref:hypothetical protein n=1 Tax=uncultured Campylobacter sp. TaxID=218934 RepID=UPI00262231F1